MRKPPPLVPKGRPGLGVPTARTSGHSCAQGRRQSLSLTGHTLRGGGYLQPPISMQVGGPSPTPPPCIRLPPGEQSMAMEEQSSDHPPPSPCSSVSSKAGRLPCPLIRVTGALFLSPSNYQSWACRTPAPKPIEGSLAI